MTDMQLGEKIGTSVGRLLTWPVVVYLHRWFGWVPFWICVGVELTVVSVWVFFWWGKRRTTKATPPMAPVVRIPGSGALQ